MIIPGLLRLTGNVVAIRVFTEGGNCTYVDGNSPGDLYDNPRLTPRLKDGDVRSGAFDESASLNGRSYDNPRLNHGDVRSGVFDASASLNGRSYGYAVGGTGWYREHFELPRVASVVQIQFDGVYMNSDMWINNVFLGNYPYGYASFQHEIPTSVLA